MSNELAEITAGVPTHPAPHRRRSQRAPSEPASPTYYDVVPSPIGDLYLTARNGAITGLHMGQPRGGDATVSSWTRDARMLAAARAQLEAYLGGELTAFDLALSSAGTPFQEQVWAELRKVPYGETISYAELAIRIGNPKAMRAVGAANGRNPIAIIVPCHRVIGANGSMTGFGGGIDRKVWLLKLEATHRGRS